MADHSSETKSLFASRTVIGIIVTLLGAAASKYGVQVAPDDMQSLADLLFQVAAVGGALYGILGRCLATKRIRTPGGAPLACLILGATLVSSGCAPMGQGLDAAALAARAAAAQKYLDATQAALEAAVSNVSPAITDPGARHTVGQAMQSVRDAVAAYRAAAQAMAALSSQAADPVPQWRQAGAAIGQAVVALAPYAIRVVSGQPVWGD